MTLYRNFFLNSISQNPFRILGVTANAPRKDIIASVNKFKAFLKVGKSVDCAYDSLKGAFKVDRTLESILTAEKSIEIPIDKLKYTLFWYLNCTPIDQIALNHIQANNIDKAIDIWRKVKSFSSSLNITVSELLRQNWASSALEADKLFTNYGTALCELVSDTLDLSSKQLMMLFIETIAKDNYDVLKRLFTAFPEAHTFKELAQNGELQYVTRDNDDEKAYLKFPEIPYPHVRFKDGGSYYYFNEGEYLTQEIFESIKNDLIFIGGSRKSDFKMSHIYHKDNVDLPSKEWDTCIRTVLAQPYIERAKQYIATYKTIPKDNTSERFTFVQSKLLSSLQEVYSYLGRESSDYQFLNNQIVKEGLQCGIDYFNAAEDPDEIAKRVKDFMWTVTLTAEPGSMLRQRCKENYDTLCEICAKLPPDSVLYYHKLLKSVIDNYQEQASTIKNASTFVIQCSPYLMSIKSVLGSTNTYYQRMCTRVADDALSDIIAEYNEKSESLHNRLDKATRSDSDNIIKLIQEMMKSAVITMYHIKQLGLELDFRTNRFNKNYEIIVKQARLARALGGNSIISMFGGELSEDDFNKALEKYAPDLRNEKEYFSSIKSLNDCHIYRKNFPNGQFTQQVNDKVEQYEYVECKSLDDLKKFKVRYPSTKCDIAAKEEEIIFKSCKTIEDYNNYLVKYSTFSKEARQKIDDLIFTACNNRTAFENYLSSYPNGSHRLEAQHKIDDIDYRGCKTAEDYDKYLKLYPHGCHVEEAKKRFEEESLWALCVKKDTWKLYKEYLDKYPYGKYNNKETKEKAVSPGEKFKKFISNNGCLTTIVVLLVIAIIIGACTNGVEGVGAVFAGFAFCCGCVTIGKGDVGGETRLVALVLAIISGLIAYCILSTV